MHLNSWIVNFISKDSGSFGGISLPQGGVILLDHRQFIVDYITLLTKGPGFQILNLTEEDYLNVIRLSLGPKSVLMDENG